MLRKVVPIPGLILSAAEQRIEGWVTAAEVLTLP